MSLPPARSSTETGIRFRDHLLTSERLAAIPWLRHGITGRIAGLSPAEANVGYTPPRDRDAALQSRQAWAEAARLDPASLVTVHQVHGNGVYLPTAADSANGNDAGFGPLPQADAMATNRPGLAMMTIHADCLPIILVEPVARAVAVIHAGWRGTTADVVGQTVAAIVAHYNAEPARMMAFLGPGIGACCYEVGDEVVALWRSCLPDRADQALVSGPRRLHLDLAQANALLLQRAGVPAQQIENCGICTCCHGDEWFSHRGQGPETGRFGAMVGIAPEQPEESSAWF